MITVRSFIIRSLRYHWRTNVALGLSAAAATAILVGALIVGDSIRGSLRQLTIERLGRVDQVLVTDRFFRRELISNIFDEQSAEVRRDVFAVEPTILLPAATVERAEGEQKRSGEVFVVGCEPSFWKLDVSGLPPPVQLARGEIILNEPLARDLNVHTGDLVTLRFPSSSQIPADSTLAQKTNRVQSIPRLKVASILPARGLGRFQLQANQGLPRNAYIALEELQDVLEQSGRINAMLVASNHVDPTLDQLANQRESLNNVDIRPQLADVGLRLAEVRRTFARDAGTDETIFHYYTLTSDRMILDPAISEAAIGALNAQHAQGVLTYLADSIRLASDRREETDIEIPYSMISGIDSSLQFPLLPRDQRLADDEIILNSWAAERLGAQPGARIVVEYFEPETAHGEHRLSSHTLTMRAIVPITTPTAPPRGNRPATYEEPPTVFNDPDLTPYVEGITDQESIENWEAPFPFDIRRMKPVDHEYWRLQRTTPKAYVNLKTAQRLWGSRFGDITSVRIAADGANENQLQQSITSALRDPAVKSSLGFVFQPVKLQGLEASAGTTPFDALFLGLSFFIILAAVLLVALMFRLNVEQRGQQLGILAAIGLPRGRSVRWLVLEGAIVSAIGGALGIVIGLGYGRLMLAGLQSDSWWLGAISTPFLEFHATPRSILIGYLAGFVVALLAIVLAARRLNRIAPRRLLAGQVSESHVTARRPRRLTTIGGVVLFVVALALGAVAMKLTGEAQAGAFVGSGALILVSLLILAWNRLRSATILFAGYASSLPRLAITSAARNPLRSTLTLGLMGFAAFLIVAMSAFRVSPSLAGAGGFRLIARSAAPLFQNLNDPRVRADLFGERAPQIEQVGVFAFRWKPGDDASCRNLYQSTQPQVLGVPAAFIEHFDRAQQAPFPWASTADGEQQEQKNPWHLLERKAEDEAIPVVIDKNTAAYSLHWSKGIGSVYSVDYDQGHTVKFRIVGLLSNTILQGTLLISEDHFRRAFPEVSGYRYFLMGGPEAQIDEAQSLFEGAFASQGFDAVDASRVLADLLAVQNTYLSTFQSLGALGLLLGTFGLATVQARSVLERRAEFAVLRAQGFRQQRVLWLVLYENLALLVAGLAIGVIAALCAILPHLLLAEASAPVTGVLLLLGVVLVAGAISAAVAMRLTLRGTLLEALRGE